MTLQELYGHLTSKWQVLHQNNSMALWELHGHVAPKYNGQWIEDIYFMVPPIYLSSFSATFMELLGCHQKQQAIVTLSSWGGVVPWVLVGYVGEHIVWHVCWCGLQGWGHQFCCCWFAQGFQASNERIDKLWATWTIGAWVMMVSGSLYESIFGFLAFSHAILACTSLPFTSLLWYLLLSSHSCISNLMLNFECSPQLLW